MPVLLEITHRVRPITASTWARYVEFYGEKAVPRMTRHGFDLLAAFKRSGGIAGEDILLVRFDDWGQAERSIKDLFRDQSGAADSAKMLAGITVIESAKLVRVVRQATEDRFDRALAEPPAQPRRFVQAVLEVAPGGQRDAFPLLGDWAAAVAGAGIVQPILAYETTMGPANELTDIWAAPAGAEAVLERPADPGETILPQLRRAAPEERLYHLDPLPYSPLR